LVFVLKVRSVKPSSLYGKSKDIVETWASDIYLKYFAVPYLWIQQLYHVLHFFVLISHNQCNGFRSTRQIVCAIFILFSYQIMVIVFYEFVLWDSKRFSQDVVFIQHLSMMIVGSIGNFYSSHFYALILQHVASFFL
jgi:hypothetical protein